MRKSIITVIAALLCGLWASPATAENPQGSYLQSCGQVSPRPATGMLFARCQRRDGSWMNTRTFYQDCVGDLYNDDGRLRCWHTTLVPSGSYLASCYNSFMGKM